LSTTLPPHEVVIVNVPDDGGVLVCTVPDKVYAPLAQVPGLADMMLQLAAPEPDVCANCTAPDWFEKLVISTIYH
jgi:hypothetical protein